MRTYIADIIPRLQQFSQKLDNLTLLTNQHWVVVDEIANSKTVYIFRSNKELLIVKNGAVEKAKWEYLGNNALLLDLKTKSYLFRHGFFDENILALKIDGKEEYAFLVNETRFDNELNSADRILEFLQRKYIAPELKKQILGTSQSEIIEPVIIPRDVIIKQEIESEKEIIDSHNFLLYLSGGLAVCIMFIAFFTDYLIFLILLVPAIFILIAIFPSEKSRKKIKRLEEELRLLSNSSS